MKRSPTAHNLSDSIRINRQEHPPLDVPSMLFNSLKTEALKTIRLRKKFIQAEQEEHSPFFDGGLNAAYLNALKAFIQLYVQERKRMDLTSKRLETNALQREGYRIIERYSQKTEEIDELDFQAYLKGIIQTICTQQKIDWLSCETALTNEEIDDELEFIPTQKKSDPTDVLMIEVHQTKEDHEHDPLFNLSLFDALTISPALSPCKSASSVDMSSPTHASHQFFKPLHSTDDSRSPSVCRTNSATEQDKEIRLAGRKSKSPH